MRSSLFWKLSAFILVLAIVAVATAPAETDDDDQHLIERRDTHDKSKSSRGDSKSKGVTTTTTSSKKSKQATTTTKPSTRRSIGSSNRPRAPITGKPVPDIHATPKPKPLSPLLAPRNPKHRRTTTTPEPELEEDEGEEEIDE